MRRISNSPACREWISSEMGLGLIWGVMASMVVLLMGTPVAAAELTATESVKSTIDEVIQVLTSEELNQPGRSMERRQKIEHVIRQSVDYEDMAKRAMGWHWIEMTDGERQQFVALFVQLLRDTFACRIDNYADEQVLYLSEQRKGDVAEVRAKLAGPKTETLLEFQLENVLGHWYLHDVVIDGAGIVSNYHAQFASILRDQSYGGLLNKMKANTLVVKGFETTMAP